MDKNIYGCKLNLISQDIKLAFISFLSQACEACAEATGRGIRCTLELLKIKP